MNEEHLQEEERLAIDWEQLSEEERVGIHEFLLKAHPTLSDTERENMWSVLQPAAQHFIRDEVLKARKNQGETE